MNQTNQSGLPELTESEREGMRDFHAVYEAHYEEITRGTEDRAWKIPVFEQLLRAMGQQRLEEERHKGRELLRRAVIDGEWRPYLDNLQQSGQAYANMNVPFAAWFDITSAYEQVLAPRLIQTYVSDPPRLTRAMLAAHRHLEIALAQIGDAYLSAKESLIVQQQQALLELSTPVLQVRDRMLILPIIGILDTRRARQLTEQLLNGIRTARAKVVVMDITGVPAVDSRVANHLLQTVSAARLMGATVVVSGLSPDVAQALVVLGVDLQGLQTVGDLQGAIEAAERLLGYVVVRDHTRAVDALPGAAAPTTSNLLPPPPHKP